MEGRSKAIALTPRCKNLLAEAAKLEEANSSAIQKEELWNKIADEFLMLGIQKEKISTEVRIAIQKQIAQDYKKQHLEIPEKEIRINSGQYYRWARKKGYTNPYFAKNKNEQLPKGNEAETSKEVRKEDDYSALRNQMIFLFDAIRKHCKENIVLIKKNHPKEVWKKFFEDESDTKKFLDKIQNMIVADLPEWNRCKDARQMILPTERFLVLAMLSHVYPKWYAKKYHALVKQKSSISGKKMSIYLDDLVSMSNLVHHTMLEPLNLHFLDLKCPGCNRYSLKTNYKMDGSWNIICINEVEHNDKKTVFPASLLTKHLTELTKKKALSANFLKERGLSVPT